MPATFDGSGPLTFNLTSNGTRLGTSGTLAIKNGTFSLGGGAHAVQGLTVDAVLKGEQLTIPRISGNVATGGIVGSFSASGSAMLPELTLAAADGALVLDAAKFTFSGIPVEQRRPSRLELSKGTLTIADATWSVAENPLVLGGTIGVSAEDPPLNLSLKGLVDLRILSALVSTVAFDGNANINTLIEGTVSKPLLDGRIVLDNAEVAVAEPRVVLSELSGPIVLDGNLAIFDGVRGLANGGALALDGRFEFEGLALSGGALNIQAQGVALELPRGMRSELDALVTFRPDPRNPSLTGDLRIVQAAYTETITLAALARQAALPLTPSNVQRPYLDRLRLDLSITTTDDIIVDNNYGRLAAGANVRVIGTVAEPGMDGRITLREGGQIFLAGRTFRITRGDISFTDRRHIHPEFNIAAEADLGTDNVTMTLTGTLERPTIDLSSEEGSRTPGEIAAQIIGSTNTETALTLLSADLLGVTGRAIGLDAFRLERGDFTDSDFRDYHEDASIAGTNNTDPDHPPHRREAAERQRRIYGVAEPARERQGHVHRQLFRAAQYRAARHLARQWHGQRRRAPSADVWRRRAPAALRTPCPAADQRDHGGRCGSRRPRRPRKPRSISRPATSSTSWSCSRTSIGSARRFTSSASSKRASAPGASSRTMRAAWRSSSASSVAPAPFSSSLDSCRRPSLIEELEEAWHKNVFDQFLIDDLTHRVRRYLVEQDELASVVVGQIDRPDADTKRLRIDVTPGAPVTAREIRFSRQHRARLPSASTPRLRRPGLEVEAWLDRIGGRADACARPTTKRDS